MMNWSFSLDVAASHDPDKLALVFKGNRWT